MPQPSHSASGLSLDSWERREEIIDRFERAWQSDDRPDLDAYLPGTEPDRTFVLPELIHTDLECRLKAGESARVEDYLDRYPDLSRAADTILELLAAEFEFRRRLQEPGLSWTEYGDRFPEYADQLQRRLHEDTPREQQSTEPSAGAPTVAPPAQRYRLLRHHAEGGLGEVLLAHDEELHRDVALKRIREPRADDAESRRRFLREAEITGRLEHPGIVPVYGLVQDEHGRPCYAMRFIEGQSFRDALADFHKTDGTPPAPAERSLVLRQLLTRFVTVCDTMAYAHSKGVVHRDLKPANIMLGTYGETLVVDWGLAKAAANDESPAAPEDGASHAMRHALLTTQQGRAMGTPAYMAPEQAAGQWDVVGPASDVYSLGATLYQLLTGRAPFEGGSLDQVQRGDFPRPRQVRPETAPALEAICLQAMALRPEERYASASDLARDVERWLAGEPVTAWPEPWTVRLRRWLQRHRTVVGSSAAALLATLVASLVAVALLFQAYASERQARGGEANARSIAEQRRQEADLARHNAEDERDRARLENYIATMGLTKRAFDEGSIGRVLELLTIQIPGSNDKDLRGFEWYYLRGACHRERLNITDHDAMLAAVAFRPDGQRLATAGGDEAIKLWDPATGKELLALKGHGGSIFAVAFSPDGKLLAAACADRHAWVWDLETPEKPPRRRAGHTNMVHGVAFSPDGKQLATAGLEGTARLWDVASGQTVRTFKGHSDAVLGVAFSPDGQRLATASGDRTVRIWETATGKSLHTLRGHGGNVVAVAFDRDGKRVASACHDHTIRLWDAAAGKPIRTLEGHTGSVHCVTFSRDGKRLASSSWDQTVRIWDADSGKLLVLHKGHFAPVDCVAFSPDGQQVASASEDHTARLWSAVPGDETPTLRGHSAGVAGVALTRDGLQLASAGGDGTIKIWETATGKELHTLKGHFGPVLGVAFSPDGRRLVSGGLDAMVRIWDVAAGTVLATGKGHTGFIASVAFSPDGRRVASASNDRTARVWNAATGAALLTLTGHGDFVNTVAFSPDGRWLASGGSDNTVRLWDAATGQRLHVLKGHGDSVMAVAFDRDGKRLAAATGAQKVRLWDLEKFAPLVTFRAHSSMVFSVAFSPDGRRVATAGQDEQVKVWEADTGKEVLALAGHKGPVRGVVFTPDGQRLVSAGVDATVRLWPGLLPTAPELLRRDAILLVRALYEKLVRQADVLDHLQHDADLRPELREAALAQARRYRQNTDQLNEASWDMVARADADEAAYRRALLQAEECVRLDPDNGGYLNTLGAALYRVGRYEEAVTTLTRSTKLNAAQLGGEAPSDLAFLARAQHQVGRVEEAKQTLERLRTAVKKPPGANDPDAQDLLKETETVLEAAGARE